MGPGGPRKRWLWQGRGPVLEEVLLVAACTATGAIVASAIGGMRPGTAALLAGGAALVAVIYRRRLR
jgi:hypothetical protein